MQMQISWEFFYGFQNYLGGIFYVLMTRLFYVWAYYQSESFHLIFYQQMADDVNFTAPNNILNVKRVFDYIWYHDSNLPVGFVEYDFDYNLGLLCVWEIESTK